MLFGESRFLDLRIAGRPDASTDDNAFCFDCFKGVDASTLCNGDPMHLYGLRRPQMESGMMVR